MGDLDNRRAEQQAREGTTGLSRPSRYAEALNRYLSAAGYPAA
ncbi:hypothetical protein [Actinoplanes sp. NPDC049316]